MAIEVTTPVEYKPIRSKRFLCGICLDYCVEWTPVVKAGMGKIYFDELRRKGVQGAFPKVRMACPNGHHKNNHWYFRDMTTGRAVSKII